MTHILILEDNKDLAEGLKDVIEGILENEVSITEIGSEAVSIFDTHPVTLALFDVNLPEKNGVETLKEVRFSGYKQPVIFMTGYRIPQVVNETFPDRSLSILSEPNIFAQIQQNGIEDDASITFAYTRDIADKEKVLQYCQEGLGFHLINHLDYTLSVAQLSGAPGLLYGENLPITEKLAHLLYLKELGLEKSALFLGEYGDSDEKEPYSRFDVTGCVFKPFDLQKLLELITLHTPPK